MPQPFDAVLIVAFGGPQGLADVRPFLANVLRGRRVAPGRVEEVAHHYELFGGVSPLTALTMRQADGLRVALGARGCTLPVYVGMRNWDPSSKDTLAHMARDGIRRTIGFIAAAHRSYSSCLQYREDVSAARADVRASGAGDVQVTYVGDWHTHRGFIDANAAHVRAALDTLPHAVRGQARVVFTAHSIPVSMAEQYPYEAQVRESARLVAEALGLRRERTVVVFQSRSGRPEDPWLGPDVCDYLRAEASQGLAAAVLCPVGFLCDHVEVLYDLDVEAADVCRQLGLPVVRAEAVNDDPRFIETMADIVLATRERYQAGTPLPIGALPG